MITRIKTVHTLKNLCIFLFSSLLLSPQMLSGQETTLFVGATGGTTFSKFKFASQYSSWDTKSQFGYKGGVRFGVQFNRFSVFSGANFVKKTGSYKTPSDYYGIDYFSYDEFGFFDYKETHRHLAVPLAVRVRLLGEDFGVTIGTGLSFNIGLGADISGQYQTILTSSSGLTESAEISSIYISQFLNYDFGSSLENEYKKVNTSWLFNIGAFKHIGENGQLHFNIGWDLGIKDIYNERYTDAFPSLVGEEITGKKLLNATTISLTYEYHFQMGNIY